MKIITNQRGSGLLALLFSVLIIGFIYYFATQNSKKNANNPNSYFKQSGIDASSYKSTIDSSKKVLDDAVKTRADVP